jgi:outer membrane receptor protein involved in Fe transport
MRMKINLLLIAFLIFLLSPNLISNDRYLSGRVMDDSGNPVLGALISLLQISPERGEKLVTVTDVNGNYKFKNMTIGKYKIAATSLDGTSFEEKTIKIEGGLQFRSDFILNLKASKSINKKSVDLNWELRSEKRDILRKEGSTATPQLTTLEDTRKTNIDGIRGEIKLTNKSLFSSQTNPSDSTQVNFSGSMDNNSQWSLGATLSNAANFQPTLSAIGKYRQKIASDLDLELGMDYQQYSSISTSSSSYDNSSDFWRGSLYTKNSWQIWEPLQLNCTLKFDHYNYVKSGDYLSPQVEIVYEPSKWAKMRGSFIISTINPESAYSDFNEIPTVIKGDVKPERAQKYEISFEGGLGGGYIMTFTAFYSDVENKKISYMQPSGQDMGRYLYNAGDAVVKGLTFDIKKDIGSWLSGSVSYSLNKSIVLDTKQLSLLFDNMDQIQTLLGKEIAHELSTRLDAEIETTNTSLSAIYSVIIGTLGDKDSNNGMIDISRLDVKIIQKLPFLSFTGTDWEINLNIRNLLDTNGLDYFLTNEDLSGMRRKISGGVSIHF